MNDYKKHIAIIGAGIGGLALGCFFKKHKIDCVIFERSSSVKHLGAGISISPNGLNILKKLDLIDQIKKISGNPKRAYFYNELKEITSLPVDIVTTSRESLYKALLNSYLSKKGEILFNHELDDIDLHNKKINFTNGFSFYVNHIVASDGINSKCRKIAFMDDEKLFYSGYSVWRSIFSMDQKNIEFYLGKNFHSVVYPINSEQVSFIAAVKTDNKTNESWKQKGSFNELANDIPANILERFPPLKNSNIFKWGVYIRKDVTKLSKENITLIGDAAHPIVPFMGQGGCLALEDAYILGELLIKHNKNYSLVQKIYKNNRSKRIKYIQRRSLNQAKLNHIKNPLISSIRNVIMKYTPIMSFMTKKIWEYKPIID